MTNTTINQPTLDQLIDRSKAPGIRGTVFTLCFLVALFDGFDTQVIAFVAPVISREWQIAAGGFGPIFAIGLVGLMIGNLVFGPMGDRYGRKPVLVICMAIFGGFALATVLAENFQQLLVIRLLTGIGLGGAMPNLIALTSEYFPARVRTRTVTLMWTGFPLGAVAGGLVGGKLIALHGWHSVFYLGGIAPLLLIPVVIALLPESIRYLVRRERHSARTQRLLDRFNANVKASDLQEVAEGSNQASSVRVLFSEGRTVSTLLLWVTFFCNLLIVHFLISWLPTVMTTAGMPLDRAIVAVAMFNLGGIIGGFVLGTIIDRIGPYLPLTVTFVAAAISTALVGQSTHSVQIALAMTFVAGFFVIAAQFSLLALTAQFYPTAGRSTGVGWGIGIGRIGSIIGPLVGGFMLAASLSVDKLLLFSALPALVAAIAMIPLWRIAARGTAQPAQLEVAPASTRGH